MNACNLIQACWTDHVMNKVALENVDLPFQSSFHRCPTFLYHSVVYDTTVQPACCDNLGSDSAGSW